MKLYHWTPSRNDLSVSLKGLLTHQKPCARQHLFAPDNLAPSPYLYFATEIWAAYDFSAAMPWCKAIWKWSCWEFDLWQNYDNYTISKPIGKGIKATVFGKECNLSQFQEVKVSHWIERERLTLILQSDYHGPGQGWSTSSIGLPFKGGFRK